MNLAAAFFIEEDLSRTTNFRNMTTYETLIKHLKELHVLGSIGGIIGWDQETMMPPRAGELRAEQLAMLSSMCHERFTSNEIGDLLEALKAADESGELTEEQAVNVRETRRSYERDKKLPTDLVEELARTRSLAQQKWAEARKESDFKKFQPLLEKTVDLKKQVAELYGYEDDIYDALLDTYEPGMTVAQLDPMFAELRERTVKLVEAIVGTGTTSEVDALKRPHPLARQESFEREIAEAFGFKFDAGRLDLSAHPFCGGNAPNDVRMTTRRDENDPLSSLYSVMHETGHGLYGQGLEAKHSGTPMGSSISLGIHESQSRTWENLVGRSRQFWEFALPRFKAHFEGISEDLEFDEVCFAANEVKPSLIRVEADEVTYNLHIILRFEIERDLMNGRVEVKELPEIWNTRMQDYLGLTPPNDALGVMQDIHWSMGGIGYFPTYTLGNLYGAQFFEAVREALPDLDNQIVRGEFMPLREWLRENIHCHGKRYSATELIERVTGKPPSSEAFLTYIETKFGELYGL